MIKINKIYIDRFKLTKTGYYFIAEKGILLNFNKNLEYEGYTMKYFTYFKKIENKVNKIIENLISKNLLEVED